MHCNRDLCCAAAHWQSNCIRLFRSLLISSDSVLTSLKSTRNNVKKKKSVPESCIFLFSLHLQVPTGRQF